MHSPPDVHVSAVMPHDWHLEPATPQLPEVGVVTHVVPEQQPVHELESQTQAPWKQLCPLPHAALAPQRQDPPEQLSDVIASHATQAAAPVPQVAREAAWHVPPSQHPLGQEDALQAQPPPEQT